MDRTKGILKKCCIFVIADVEEQPLIIITVLLCQISQSLRLRVRIQTDRLNP